MRIDPSFIISLSLSLFHTATILMNIANAAVMRKEYAENTHTDDGIQFDYRLLDQIPRKDASFILKYMALKDAHIIKMKCPVFEIERTVGINKVNNRGKEQWMTSKEGKTNFNRDWFQIDPSLADYVIMRVPE